MIRYIFLNNLKFTFTLALFYKQKNILSHLKIFEMKILRKIFIGIVAIIATLLIVALFVPKQYTVTVAETINKPRSVVFDYVKNLKNQENYSIWVMEDIPSVSYKGTDGAVGAIQIWNSKNENVGEGEQEIKAISEARIDYDLRFKRPFESNQKAALILNTVTENQTQVVSEFYGSDAYPMNLMSFIGKGIIKDAQIKNMHNLKVILEK
jgi:hypothetical protein